MIRKINYLTVCLISAGLLSSCTLSHTCIVTNNPVGSKRGVMSTSSWDANYGVTFAGAVKDGRIEKAGISEFKNKNLFIMTRLDLVVTGE